MHPCPHSHTHSDALAHSFMPMLSHAHMHPDALRHLCPHCCTHLDTLAFSCPCSHTCTPRRPRTLMPTHTCSHTRCPCTLVLTLPHSPYTLTCIHTNTDTLVYIHTHMHTHTHTHSFTLTHKYILTDAPTAKDSSHSPTHLHEMNLFLQNCHSLPRS